MVAGIGGVLSATPAAAETPHRSGFTLELGLGLGTTSSAESTEFGPMPFALSLGGFVGPSAALLVRMAGTTYLEEVDGATVQVSHSLLGVVVEYWPTDLLMLSAGPAAATLGTDSSGDPLTGWGALLRVGTSVANWENHNLRVALELTPARYGTDWVLGTALTFEFQWF